MLLARTDMEIGGVAFRRGAVLPPGTIADEFTVEAMVRAWKLWRINDEALTFALAHFNAEAKRQTQEAAEPKAQAGGKRR